MTATYISGSIDTDWMRNRKHKGLEYTAPELIELLEGLK